MAATTTTLARPGGRSRGRIGVVAIGPGPAPPVRLAMKTCSPSATEPRTMRLRVATERGRGTGATERGERERPAVHHRRGDEPTLTGEEAPEIAVDLPVLEVWSRYWWSSCSGSAAAREQARTSCPPSGPHRVPKTWGRASSTVVEIPPEVWVTGPPQRKATRAGYDHEGGHDPCNASVGTRGGISGRLRYPAARPGSVRDSSPQTDIEIRFG